MNFNTKEINKFIKYYKYFIILRNVLSNYYKTDIKNIKLEFIKIDKGHFMSITKETFLNLKFIINNNSIDINLKIKPFIYAMYISNYPKYDYEFNYNFLLTKSTHNMEYYIQKKYFYLQIKTVNLIKKIISKKILLKNLNTIRMKYYYNVYYYKICIIYKRFPGYFRYGDPSKIMQFNEYSYISKLLI